MKLISPTGAVCGGLFAAALMSTTGAVHAEDIVIRMLNQGTPAYLAAYEEASKAFEAENPGIDIELQIATHDAYPETFAAAALAGDLPDLVELDAPFLANYVWSGYLQPISDLIDPDLLADMTESNIAQGTYPIDGKLYAIGLADSTVLLYGNREYLEQVGARIPTSVEDAWTVDELEDIMAKLAELDEVEWPIDLYRAYGVKSEWITYAYEPALVSAGCDVIDRDTWTSEGTLDSEPCVETVQKFADWVENGWVVPASAGENQFSSERKAALAWGGHWVYGGSKPNLGDDLVVMPLPKFGEKNASPNGTWIWAISANSEHPEETAKWLSYLLKSEPLRKTAMADSAFPGLNSYADSDPNYNGGEMMMGVEQANKIAFARPPHPAYPTITSAVQQAFDTAFNGGDVKDALTKAAREIDEDIEDNDGYPPFNE